ncbi:cysteine synthase A [Sulfurimonas gotlandica GD1]|uniref:Cysteine synthase n=1 Tax=Sulfurimonas gotlandica (strain DSM 19862 / JCM 16533 / GD1) TaxID=929558 RepID=B6BNF2_SULGG|nr:cysteine synthase A [Sulfurimonas gotlandica]EDZ61380.1 cysteine synthase A [Sulfurimonas gotlandica GD1]EHP31022.1 cysteine synthase A [Sulfurimonas gotlandica GD1]
MNIAKDVTELIGNTPLVRINKFSNETKTTILGKCEFMNPSSSVKDRIALAMIDAALEDGKINEGTIIVEPTSGNTGIGLAMVCAAKGLNLTLTMPESMSMERRQLLTALGANIVLTPAATGMKGAIDRAAELDAEMPNSFMPQQFNNPANPRMHRKTTALEILRDTDGKIDFLVAAVGTGGSLTGIGEVLKEVNPNIKVIAVEPSNSPVISGGKPGPHKIQGIGAGIIPGVLNTKIFDEVIKVTDEDAFATSKELAKTEGLLVGISSGANVFIARQIAARPENKGKTIVTILCDTGERYLSTSLYS